jgi:hypothetical protein
MIRFRTVLFALVLAACDSSTDVSLAIAGNYTLTAANGTSLPALYTVPFFGSVLVTSGSGTIGSDGSVSVSVNTEGGGVPNTTWTAAGTVTQQGSDYVFTFSDVTATGSYSGGKLTIDYPPNNLVFTKN